MKRRDLLTAVRSMAHASETSFDLVRYGASHDIYRVDGLTVVVPRHTQINEMTARGIIRDVQDHLRKGAS
jgi:mRNA interferase HicA